MNSFATKAVAISRNLSKPIPLPFKGGFWCFRHDKVRVYFSTKDNDKEFILDYEYGLK